MTFFCPYFSPKVTIKLTRMASGHFVTLIEIGTHLTERNPGENRGRNRYNVERFLCAYYISAGLASRNIVRT